jgi:uncharacterized membrane-anchored protein YitT (DUF2179 family)
LSPSAKSPVTVVGLVLYSLALSCLICLVLEHVLTIFNQRKMALIISDMADAIAAAVRERLGRRARFLDGSGTNTGRRKKGHPHRGA